jgi:predicted ATP-dependent serine protease
MQAWPPTGRAEELSVIAGVLCADEAYAGVLIAGSAGVGKTRLAREAATTAADRGWAVHWVAGTVAAQSTFAKGASLDDPSSLFNSSLDGNTRRAIDIHEDDKINEKALKTLIRAAVALNTSKKSSV